MIELFSGTPGSGKSLHSADLIKWHLRMKKPLICNFDISHKVKNYDKYFQYIPNEKLSPELLIRYSQEYFNGKRIIEDTIMLVIDECQLIFNAREWNALGRDKWLSFYTQHRHYGYHIILIAQFDRMIDRQIRCLIEYNYLHRKVKNIGWHGQLLNIVCGGKMFVAVKKYYPLNEKVGQEFFKAKKSLYSIYDTYAILDKKQDSLTTPPFTPKVTVSIPDNEKKEEINNDAADNEIDKGD